MAMKKPIITTNFKGCKETCVNDHNGLIVEPKSSDSLFQAMIKFNQLSESRIKKMGESSHKLFLEKFEQNVVFQSISKSISIG
jgi:glycosyltransferase involved in cell wall biosynthesis